jgi:hypothetical protein
MGVGTQTSKVGLNGLWLVDEFKGEFGGAPFEARGLTSYDPAKKKYVNVWVDSMSTSPRICEGTYDKATKTMTLAGAMPLPDGSSMKITETTVFKDANTRVLTLKGKGPDGSDMDLIQVTFKRHVKQ